MTVLSRLVILTVLVLSAHLRLPAADTDTRTFHPAFRTLQVVVEDSPLAPTVIMSGSSDRIIISFDELTTDRRYMRYELIHCDHLWNPDRLVASEFLPGFNEAPVDQYAYSRATTTHYVNYRIAIPDGDMNPLVSGNYLVRVYDESQPDSTLLQARFSLCEPLVTINASVSGRTDMDFNSRHQQLSVIVDLDRLDIPNPASDLKVVITRNGRTDDEVVLTSPAQISGRSMSYTHLPRLIYPAGNEYRRFETVSLTYPGMGVDEITFNTDCYTHTLIPDEPRSGQVYAYDRTQFGRYTVRNQDASDSDTEAEYTKVYFSLRMPQLPDLDVYIEGDLTGRRFDPESKMTYNAEHQCYEKELLLKQGAYNYQYLTMPGGATRQKASTGPIEGDYYQTVNEYVIKVYHCPPASRYDSLVGTAVIYSDR